MIVSKITNIIKFFPKSLIDVLIVFNADLFGKAFAALAQILLIRNLSKSDYGYFTAFLYIMTFIGASIGNGFNIKTVNIISKDPPFYNKNLNNVFSINLVLQLSIFMVASVTVIMFSKRLSFIILGNVEYSKTLIFGVFSSLGFIIIQIGKSFYQARSDFKIYGLILNLRQASLLFGIGLLIMTSSINFIKVSYIYLVVQIIIGLLILFFIKPYIAFHNIKTESMKSLFQQGSVLTFYYILLSATEGLGIVVLARYHALETVAEYGVAFRYFSLSLMLLSSIHTVFIPKLSKDEFCDYRNQIDFVKKWVRKSFWSIIPIFFAVLFSNQIFFWLNGPGYSQAAFLFRILSVGLFISLIFSPMTGILITRNDGRFLSIISLLIFLATLIGSLSFVPKYGASASATITMLSYVFINTTICLRIIYGKAQFYKTSR